MRIENLNAKQKVVLGIFAIIAISVIIIYVYSENEEIEENISLYIEEESIEEETEKIYIHISGEVEEPGIIELLENDRLNDAIIKAGGLTESGEIKYLNLAQKLKDGEKIHIPSLDEVLEMEENEKWFVYEDDLESDEKLINLNTSSIVELESLPGIGEATALKIIAYREGNGKFENIEDIMNVSGIGEAKFGAIKDLIEV